LSGSELEKWVCQELQSRGASAEPAAIKELIRRTGNESWMLVQEIDKLSNYCGATAIRAEDVGSVVAERSELNIFEFTDALSAKDKPRALSLLYRELNSGRDPYSVLALVIHQFRNLMMVKDLTLRSSAPAGIAVKVGVPPFVAQKLTAAARKFEQPELAADYRRLQDLDTGVKQGKIDLKDALYSFVLRP
jgi:DNA polymerase-3 subunit delta